MADDASANGPNEIDQLIDQASGGDHGKERLASTRRYCGQHIGDARSLTSRDGGDKIGKGTLVRS